MVFSVVYFILAGTGLAAVSEFRVNTYTTGTQVTPAIASNDEGSFVIAWSSFGQDGSFFGIYAQRYDRNGNPAGEEFRVNTQTADIQDNPAVAMDAAGNFVVCWQSILQDGDGYGIYVQRYDRNGTPLGVEFKANTHIASHQAFPAIAMNAAGGFVVVWTSFDQDAALTYGIYAQRFDGSGNPSGNEFQVNTHTASDQKSPSIAMNAAGSFVVAWESFGQDAAGTYGIYAQRYDLNGTPLGTEFKVNTHTASNQAAPSVAMNAAGNFVVAWQSLGQDEAGTWGIYAQRYDLNGIALGAEFKVNTHTASDQAKPSMAMNAAGNFAIAWESLGQDAAGTYGIYAQRYDANGLPLGTEFKVNTHTVSNQQFTSMAMSTAGNFVVVWQSFDQDAALTYGIYAQRFDPNGNLIGSESPVNTFTPSVQRDPAAAMDAGGNFVIAWESDLQDGSGNGVYAQRFDRSGNPLGLEFKVNTHTLNNQNDPSVAMDAVGNFVIAWESDLQDGSGNGVYAQRFDRSGNPLGLEFKVNTFTAGSQSNPAVAMDRQGNFVIVWQSFGQDEAASLGIYAQRFDAGGNPLGIEFKVNTFVVGDQDTPDVAMNPEGRFLIVWESFGQDAALASGIYAQRFDADGNPAGGEFRVNTHTADSQDDPKVAMDGEGNFVVVWESNLQDGSVDGVYAQRFDRDGTPLGIEFRVNTHTPESQDTPDVVMDRDGNFIIAWESTLQDGSVSGVYARRYDRDGNPGGGEFRINTVSDDDQGAPTLAMAPHGQWVIAWESFGQDGSDFGVFMKLFIKNFGIYLPLILR
jgi:hypothetical protein